MEKRPLKPSVPLLLFLILAAILATVSSGCSGTDAHSDDLKMAPLAEMPQEVRDAPVAVQQSYQFAIANPDVLEEIPCYCGCGAMGHGSNYACYASGQNPDGSPAFDSHALGCSICVDITQDTMRLLKEGKTVPEIRSYVDSTYAQYGPSNMP